jgi:hypothetical protein
MDVPAMSLELHERGIHAVRSGAGEGGRDGSPFPVRAAADGDARADQDQNKLNGIAPWG